MKIKLTLSYDGSNYAGWQVQDNALTIQQVLEDALYKLTGEKIKTTASGRTDAGVHALGQVVSFYTNSSIPADKFFLALNPLLPEDIKATFSEQTPDDFDALRKAFDEAKTVKGMSTAIVAKTTKGKGVSYMEDNAGWHGKAPNDEEYAQAMDELTKEGERLCQM